MTDIADQIEQIDQPEPEAPQPDGAPPPEPPTEPQGEQSPEWQRQFPGGADEIYRSWQETRATLTREQQQRAEYERQLQEYQQTQQPQDPWSQLPPQVDEYQQQQIAAYAQRDPAAAAKWAYENYHDLGPEVAGQLFQYWQSRDYWGAEAWKAEQLHAQWREQESQRLNQELQPVREYTHQQMSQLTLDIASKQIPNWDHWMPRVVDFLEQPENSVWVQALNSTGVNSQAAADRLYDIYAVLHARDQRGRQAAQSQPAQQPQPGAQTETANTADNAPARDENGRFVQDPGRRQGRLARIEGLD
jgi:hypothetical protein